MRGARARSWRAALAVPLAAALSVGAQAGEVTEGAGTVGGGAAGERRVAEELKRADVGAALKGGEELYEKGEYRLSLERLDTALTADDGNEEALLFAGLVQLRLDNPAKAAVAWGKLQERTKDERLSQDLGRMQTILLREVSERAAKEAVAREKQLSGEPTNARTVAVATFRNAGSAEYAPLGKALAAMLIDNLSGLPGVKVLEREQVEALEAEAKLSGSGLVEAGTAVRAGKLLRAGRVAAGSHVDWTASPTHLRLDALLVDVDTGSKVGEGKSEALSAEFFKLVPAVAEKFAAALGGPVDQLPPPVKQKVQQEHTRSLEAALQFGKALDGIDRHDAKAALEACKELEKADPSFELAKKKCAFIPPAWLTMQGVASAMEPTALAMAGIGASSSSYWGPAVVGALVVGGIAGGTYAATSGGGNGGGNNGTNPSGNNAPALNGVSDRTVGAGQTASIDMDCRDPDGTVTTIAAGSLPPGGSFNQTSGNPATGRYRQTTTSSQVGQSFEVRFTCTDSGNPPASTTRSATIRVARQPQPTPTPEPTPVPCRPPGDSCSAAAQCCLGLCGPSFSTTGDACCIPAGARCDINNDLCCSGTTFGCDCTGPGGELVCCGGVP